MKQDTGSRNLDIELEKARMVQNLLLPADFPANKYVDFAYRFMPYYDMSGDFLDYFYKKSTNELGFIICDVSGHGIPSALLAVMMKMALQLWGEYLSDTVGTLTKIRNMYKGKLGAYYVSAILGYLNLNTGMMSCVNAGHPAMLHLDSENNFIEIKPKGSIIHENVNYPFEEYTLQLKTNDRLILYTDGITEARNKTEQELEIDGLKKIILNNDIAGVDQLCDNIMNKILTYTDFGQKISDDMSLFVIEYKGK